jgi:hypothetical protein
VSKVAKLCNPLGPEAPSFVSRPAIRDFDIFGVTAYVSRVSNEKATAYLASTLVRVSAPLMVAMACLNASFMVCDLLLANLVADKLAQARGVAAIWSCES